MAEFFNGIWSTVINLFSNPLSLILDLLDIAIISFLIYTTIKFIRDTRAAQLLKGIVLLFVILIVTNWVGLTGTHYILNTFLEFGVLALIIVFQPELRSALEQVGRNGIFQAISQKTHMLEDDNEDKYIAIDAICNAISSLSATKTGALIVMEDKTRVGDIIRTGTRIDANISPEILLNIFYPKAPLHDGAVIIRDFKITAAGCFLPLSTKRVASDLGTRHRAAIGMSENSDAIIIVVSEETGIISLAQEGNLTRNYSPELVKTILTARFIPQNSEDKKRKKLSLFRKEKKQ